jgi:ubiquinone/menaquinone biosynthesis C-methylase UbiE
MKNQILQYYDNLAIEYDKNRFGNSYGEYINIQENRIIKKYLKTNDKNLDIACGTGRLLNYANYGIDISPKMVAIAKQKHPYKNIVVGDIEELNYENSFFRNAYSFHLFMHLELHQLKKIFKKVSEIVEKDGLFILDIPSKKRRKLTKYKADSWHGRNQINLAELKEITAEHWKLVSYYGVAFFPIHLIPKKIRKFVLPLDNLMCRSIFKEMSSHIVYILKKK